MRLFQVPNNARPFDSAVRVVVPATQGNLVDLNSPSLGSKLCTQEQILDLYTVLNMSQIAFDCTHLLLQVANKDLVSDKLWKLLTQQNTDCSEVACGTRIFDKGLRAHEIGKNINNQRIFELCIQSMGLSSVTLVITENELFDALVLFGLNEEDRLFACQFKARHGNVEVSNMLYSVAKVLEE